MKDIFLTITGLPIAKKRHRTGNGRTYNPQSEVEKAAQWEIKKELHLKEPLTDPLILTLDAYFPRPKSHYGTGRNLDKLKPSAPKFHAQKPDHDNIIKFYMDCMNKLVFQDDVQVVGFGECGKHWIDKKHMGRVEIRLTKAEGVR